LVHIVNALLLTDGQVLMARRSPFRATWPDCWSFPGGHVEPGETLEQALIRELIEEIGVVPKVWALVATLESRPDSITFHMFAVTSWSGEPTMLGDEHSELRWLDTDEAASLPALALETYSALLLSLNSV
jgi:mutator protein MutT